MSMRRTRSGRAHRPCAVTGEDKRAIRLDSVSLLAGIAPGLELEPTVGADGPVPSSAPVSVGVGERHVRRSDVESYRQSLLRRVPGKPGD